MSPPASGLEGFERNDIQSRLTAKAYADEAFKQELMHDPRAVIAKEFGVQLPPGVKINVVEETATNWYIPIPPPEDAFSASGELSDETLEMVAGGKGDPPPPTEPKDPKPKPQPRCCGLCMGTTTNCPK